MIAPKDGSNNFSHDSLPHDCGALPNKTWSLLLHPLNLGWALTCFDQQNLVKV